MSTESTSFGGGITLASSSVTPTQIGSINECDGGEQYAGCMTAGGYSESYCEAFLDHQRGP